MPVDNECGSLKTRADVIYSDSEAEVDDLKKLESEVKNMAAKILEYRRTLPDQLKTTLSSFLSAQRPPLAAAAAGLDSGPSLRNSDSERTGLDDEEEKNREKLCLLKQKFSNNVSTMPLVIKRLNECISRIDKLDCSVNIPPAFKKTKTS